MSGKSKSGFNTSQSATTSPNSACPPHSTPMNPKTAQKTSSSRNYTSNHPFHPSQLTETKQPDIGSNLDSNPLQTPGEPRADPERTASEPQSDPIRTPLRTVRNPPPPTRLPAPSAPATTGTSSQTPPESRIPAPLG
jgi:hypothetical protein